MSPWQEHCEGKKDLESFVKSVEEFADSLYTVIADRAGEMIKWLLIFSHMLSG